MKNSEKNFLPECALGNLINFQISSARIIRILYFFYQSLHYRLHLDSFKFYYNKSREKIYTCHMLSF